MASTFTDELRGWKETESMSDDARRKVWLMHTAAIEIERLRAALDGIASLGGKTLLGPAHDTERLHAEGAAAAFEQAAELARAALEG